MEKQRLDKFLSDQQNLSRSTARDIIRQTGLYVNGKSCYDPGFTVDAETAEVIFKGKRIIYKKYIYILMNKPSGVLTATKDRAAKTVLDLIPDNLKRKNLFPVGRLDKDTTGLLLITDDGEFSHNCITPSKSVKKIYEAELDGTVTDRMGKIFLDGVVLADGTVCKSAVLEKTGEKSARIIITEGKYHQIKRMFGAVGLGVNSLRRISIGALVLPPFLKEGECTELSSEDALTALKT